MSNKEITVTYSVDDTEIRLTQSIVSEYLAGGNAITMPEFKMFSELCRARKLNPFLKEAYIIKYGSSPAQIVVGKDAILKRAALHPKFDGREQGIIVIDSNGNCIEKNGTFLLESETLVGGWAKVYRKDWQYPVYVTVSFKECAQRKRDGSLNAQWGSKGATMIEKVALVRALREAFVEESGGMFEEEELDIKEKVINEVVIGQEPIIQDEPEQGNSETIDINDL